jgi:hypothetical protein
MFSCCFGECPSLPYIEDNVTPFINTNNKKYIVIKTKKKLHVDNNEIFTRLYLPKKYKDNSKLNFIE